MNKKPFLFIINPNSGTSNGNRTAELVQKIKEIAHGFEVETEIMFTKSQGHAREIVRNNKYAKEWKAIVAVGGDGTVNEVASELLSSAIPLGILPMGSGNGLARHLGIPMHLEKALVSLFKGTETTIDSALLNDIPFFCTAGVGFDAFVGKLFSEQKTRGLLSYIRVTIQSFWCYKPQQFILNGIKKEAFSITIANAGQYGNNAWIAPQASLRDGKLNICTIHKFPFWFGIPMVYMLFNKAMKESKYVEYQQVTETILETKTPQFIHYDGEPLLLTKNKITIKIIPNSLKIIV